MRRWTPVFLLLLFGILAGCSKRVDPGLYRARLASEEGFLRVAADSAGVQQACFYRDTGWVWADSVRVRLRPVARQNWLCFADGHEEPVTLTPYTPPEFQQLTENAMFVEPRYAVKETQDLIYGRILKLQDSDAGGTDLTLDVYRPVDDGMDARPLLLMLHGGAFQGGDKRDSTLVEWSRYFASLGYVVSSVGYRVGWRRRGTEADEAMYRALKDANAAVRFLLKRDSLRIDSRWIYAAGVDAGAVTALQLACLREDNIPETMEEGEDTLVAVRQPIYRGFDVRAVANYWGAIPDTALLYNARIPVLSYQSTEDPVIPFEEGYPYEDLVEGEEEPGFLQSVLESLLSLFLPEYHPFPKFYGAGTIHRILKACGTPSELHTVDAQRHDLIHLEDGSVDFPLFDEIAETTARFFSAYMVTNPVSLRQDPEDPQVFVIDATEVEACYWQVEGGAVISKSDDTLRVLMFPDEDTHTVTVSGRYTSGITFFEKLSL